MECHLLCPLESILFDKSITWPRDQTSQELRSTLSYAKEGGKVSIPLLRVCAFFLCRIPMLYEGAPGSPRPSIGPDDFWSLNSERHTFLLCSVSQLMARPYMCFSGALMFLTLSLQLLFSHVAACLLCGWPQCQLKSHGFSSFFFPPSSSRQLPRVTAHHPWGKDFF